MSKVIFEADEFKKRLNAYEDSEIIPITTETELGQTLKELNKDVIESQSMNSSSVDQRTRLHYIEVQGITEFDFLISVKFLPKSLLPLTRQKKRNNISLDGLGRKEIVQIASAKIERDAPMTFWEKAKNLVGGQK